MNKEAANVDEVLSSLKKLFSDMGYTIADLFVLAVLFFKGLYFLKQHVIS